MEIPLTREFFLLIVELIFVELEFGILKESDGGSKTLHVGHRDMDIFWNNTMYLTNIFRKLKVVV